jgi:hypothetical protein
MSDSHAHGGHSHDVTIPSAGHKPALHFTPEEWDEYRKRDAAAARAVVLLMGGIFSVGLVLYTTVAYICWYRVM